MPEGRGRGIHGVELVRFGEWKRIEEYTVDDGEEGGVGADAQSESEDGDGGEAGILEEHAHAVADVLPKIHHRHPGQIDVVVAEMFQVEIRGWGRICSK